ncbi:MAG: tetratricopeptide repeat protein [Candidatus Omnitrophica bacterium]|nr:tetratricopeptide repeat protein [Candidatus Omnitrophota bacterium]MBU4488590.1 tetratricopeptide repeat protein [Candidatus Omnitrophota bacterium]MCG2704470.1 tetratricopeptide repeat protein [Candidatus Omnitrophota bacterium]
MHFYTPRIHKYIIAGFIAASFMAILVLQASINYSRVTEDLEEAIVIMPGEFATNFVIGGFRGLAVDLLWLKLDELWHEGKWFDIIPILRSITWMQPHFLEAWELGAWHLAYNCYAYAESAGIAEKDMYIDEGIRFLKEGIARNRNVYDLWFNLGWIYYHKLKNYEEGIRHFRAAIRYKHPSYIDRLIAHAYRKEGDIESEYKEWQRCLTVFTDDPYHMQLSREHLEKAKEKLIEAGKLKK